MHFNYLRQKLTILLSKFIYVFDYIIVIFYHLSSVFYRFLC
nr:MAG TPA: hypothetical protein [Caudoviricetes sp.]DAN47258.1 MAG TPA: hypothetical protein [Caudoviricetes sp.]